MEKLGYAGLLLAVVILVAACGAGPTATPGAGGSGLGPAPWQNGSTANYEWLDQSGAQIGTSQFDFSLNVDVWTITEKDNISGLEQTAEMRISAATLAPLGETKTIHTASSDVQVTTKYENGKLSINAVVGGQNQSATLDVPPNAIDNDQLLMTLRALPFAEGYTADYVVIVAQNALKVDTTVTVQSKESVTVPAGTFDAWRVEISADQGTQSAWYQVDAPHMLVQYQNGPTRMVLTNG